MSTTITIAGRRFPAVALICPPDDDHPNNTDADRELGGTQLSVFIPAENGVLFEVAPDNRPGYAEPGNLTLTLCTTVCELFPDIADGTSIWLPVGVALMTGTSVLLPRRHGTFCSGRSNWLDAEPEWVVETIDRLSRLPFTMPEGPQARMVPTDYFERIDA